MKNLFSVIFPSIVIFIFIWIDSMFPESKYILLGIYLLFPLMFIIQGYICLKLKRNLILGFLLSSIAIILPISIWYNMGSVITPVIIYILLGTLPFFLFNKNKKVN